MLSGRTGKEPMRQLLVFTSLIQILVLSMLPMGCGNGDRLVDLGLEDFMDMAGIQDVEVDGVFAAEDYVAPGLPTIIEFYSDSCIGCRQLHQNYKKFLPLRPDVAVRRIQLPDRWDPQELWQQYHIRIFAIPHIIVYGPNGELIAADDGDHKDGFDFLYRWMDSEVRKARSLRASR
jgi:hypothetical protein